MEIKEAIRRIKDHFRIHDDGRPTPYLNEAVKIAIESMEKHIPIEHHHTVVNHINDEIRTSICPSCLFMIHTHKADFPKFCNECGQAIKWEDHK